MFITLDQHTIHFECYGNGPALLCCLPGYGETGKSFECLALELQEQYTILCPDLPLQGLTKWQKTGFELEDLHRILQSLAGHAGFAGRPMSLAGYSMGGRLALAYAEQYPQFLSGLILIAPDGLKLSFWYWLSTQTKAGNKLFKATMANANWLFSTMKWARKGNLLNASIVKFAHKYLDDPQQRSSLYDRWTLYRKFRPTPHKIKQIINNQPLPTLLVFGLFDRIIPHKLSGKLSGADAAHLKILVMEAGHRLLKPQFAATIAASINTLQPA